METKQLHLSKNGEASLEFVRSDMLERYDALALEALEECRAQIAMAMRYLSGALWRLPAERAPLTFTLATSGRVLRYDPENILNRYADSPAEMVRDCVHTVLHCVFQHPFDTRHDEHDAWSLACDMAVEACALELCGARFPCEADRQRAEALRRMRELARSTGAPALYRVLRSGKAGESLYRDFGLSYEDVKEYAALFKRDEHDLWASYPREEEGERRHEGESAPAPDLQRARTAPEQDSAAGRPGSADEGGGEDDALHGPESGLPGEADPQVQGEQPADEPDNSSEQQEQDAARDEWRKVGKQVEAAVRAQAATGRGSDSPMLVNLSVANRAAANYDDFLRRFATVGEDMCVNDDEFDYIFYTYGLNRYGNMPLVEPLEYKETNRVREFVVAIDTSASCSGELVKAFVQRTFDVLRQQQSFGAEINVHLVQCDNRIRTVTKVESLRQLEGYRDSFWVSGGGGTDFTPVFEYVDGLVAAGEFEDLRGVIYFTDGYGTFPTRAPDYEAAFVFVDVEGMNVRVPPWAMKVVMTQEEVLERQG